jgi:hypothetical protein
MLILRTAYNHRKVEGHRSGFWNFSTSESAEIPPNEPQSRTLLDPSAARPWLESTSTKGP